MEAHGRETGRRNILHVIDRERAGQVRGVPVLAPVLEALKQLGRYTEAEINAAVISAMFTVFVESAYAAEERPFGEMIPPDQLIDTQDQSSIELGNGAVVSLNTGKRWRLRTRSTPTPAMTSLPAPCSGRSGRRWKFRRRR